MKNILVPIDFSPCAFSALEYALELNKVLKGKLIIMHAVQVPILADGESETGAEIREEVQLKFDETLKRIPELESTDYSFELSFDLITIAIRSKVERDQVDLVIMGTKGATGAREIFLGSNTYETIKQVNCPVLAVPEENSGFHIGSIAFASDYRQVDSYNDLDALLELARLRNSHLHILHVGDTRINRDELEVGKSQDQYFRGIKHSYHFINGTQVADEIKQYIKANKINMLALYARRHDLAEKLFHKSVTQDMAYHSEVPLLVLPEGE